MHHRTLVAATLLLGLTAGAAQAQPVPSGELPTATVTNKAAVRSYFVESIRTGERLSYCANGVRAKHPSRAHPNCEKRNDMLGIPEGNEAMINTFVATFTVKRRCGWSTVRIRDKQTDRIVGFAYDPRFTNRPGFTPAPPC